MQICRFFFIAVTSLLVPLAGHAANAYARVSSLTTQLPPSKGYALVQMDTIEELKNIALNDKRDRLVIQESGLYFLIAAGQVGSNTRDATGYIDMWFEKNGKPVNNSNARLMISTYTDTAPLSFQIVIDCVAGDTIATAYAASGPSIGFIYTKPDNEPAITSFSLSMFKLDNQILP